MLLVIEKAEVYGLYSFTIEFHNFWKRKIKKLMLQRKKTYMTETVPEANQPA